MVPGQLRNIQVGKSVLNCYLSYPEPMLYNRSNYLWQDYEELKCLPAISKQQKIQEEINRVNDSVLEQQKYLKRQLEAHAANQNNAEAQNNNPHLNGLLQENQYLQRRKLNIEEEEQHIFNSDDEEEKAQKQSEYEKLFRQPQPVALINFAHDLEEAKEFRKQKKDSDIRAGILFKEREVPKSREFLDSNGNPQRNAPMFELEEIWEIPDELEELAEDSNKLKST